MYSSDKPKNVTLKITRTNVCIESAVTFKCGARANLGVEYYQLYENSVQIVNGSKYGVWNKTTSKEGEYSYTFEAKTLVGIRIGSSVNVTVTVLCILSTVVVMHTRQELHVLLFRIDSTLR